MISLNLLTVEDFSKKKKIQKLVKLTRLLKQFMYRKEYKDTS